MPNYICITCGAQFSATDAPPAHCPICEDERQYINANGQQWTTIEAMRADHKNEFTTQEPGMTSIRTTPAFAISQQAYLIQTPQGNVLWDCISLLDEATIEGVKALGGLSAITLSHPHLYGSMVEWSHAFGGISVYVHADDAQWVMRPDPVIQFWQGESQRINDHVTLVRCGGHFPGSSVLHWADGAEGKGVLLTSDTMMVVNDTRYLTFMYSYPNYLPLPRGKVQQIVDAVQPYAFDRIYGSWPGRIVRTDAKNAVKISAERFINLITQ